MIQQRITFAEVVENDWFKKGYKPPVFEQPTVSLDDVNSIFSESLVSLWFCCLAWLIFFHQSLDSYLNLNIDCGTQDSKDLVVERREEEGHVAPVTMNAFELISKSQGLNLSSLFEKQMVCVSS